MIVAIHQPNFLPWIGYFYKMLKSDIFVFLDNVQFSKGSYTNRTKIKINEGEKWLTVPVETSNKFGQMIKDITCCGAADWRAKIIGSIKNGYCKSRNFSLYAEDIFAIISSSSDYLCDLNISLITYIAKIIDLKTDVIKASNISCSGESSELLISICKSLGANVYLSGSGGRGYQDDVLFHNNGIEIIYTDYKHRMYRQLFGNFVDGLSIIDLLFNEGEDSIKIIKDTR